MKKMDAELAAGFFLLLGILALGYVSLKLGKLEVLGGGGYTVYAEFSNAEGIRTGSAVEIAGVDVGKVKSVRLDRNYEAVAGLFIYKSVRIQEDAIASVRTKGLIGEKYIQISPGASEKYIPDKGRIQETESSVDIENLLSKYIYGKV